MEVKKMSTSSGGRKQPTAISRMKQDYMRLKRDPLPYITAEPMPNNILEWHYVVKGPENSPYHGGYYHGTLLFPREFPFKPPSIYMLTPNGRFRTNTRLCLSISDFHPDTWNPTWCVGTILTGLLSFMLETTPTLGSVESTQNEKLQLARKSLAFNLKNPNFRELFPDICGEINKRLKKQQRFLERQSKSAALAAAPPAATANITANDATAAHASTAGLVGSHNINESLAVNGAVEQINRRVSSSSTSKKSFINWPALYSNLVIGLSFAIFALIVNYVIKNLNQE